MFDKPIVMRARLRDGVTSVKALITHPMERGDRMSNDSGEILPPHFIQEVICESGGRVVLTALLSGEVARDPFLAFSFQGANQGDTVKITWVDNRGNSGSSETAVE